MISLMFLVVLTAAVCAFAQAAAERPRISTAEATTGQPAEVSGRLLTYDNRPLLSAAVIMSPLREDTGEGSAGQATIHPDGRFVFSAVPPGRYVLRARGETERQGASLFATFAVTVQGRDVSGIQLTLGPGATLQGRIEVQPRRGSPLPPLASLRVRAPLADGSAFGDTLSGTVQPDGRFRLSGVMAGAHVLMIEGLPFPWRIVEARLRGRDAVENAFDIDGDEDYRGTRIVLSDTAAGVSGVVSVPAGTDPDGLLVVAFPVEPLRRRVPLRFVRVGRVSHDGGYRVVDLTPGDYFVAAARVTEREAMRGEVLERLLAEAQRVRLGDGQVASVRLAVARATPRTMP